MHVTKNLCVNLLGFLGLYGKIKDTKEARQDQQHVKDPEDRPPKLFQGCASYALTKEEKITFFECLKYQGPGWILIEYKGNNKYGREKVPKPKVS
jgi:hypothetical protein